MTDRSSDLPPPLTELEKEHLYRVVLPRFLARRFGTPVPDVVGEEAEAFLQEDEPDGR